MPSSSIAALDKRNLVDCFFYVREPATGHPGKYRYTRTTLNGQNMNGAYRTAHPPVPGDLIDLADTVHRDLRGVYRVIGRHWFRNEFCSANWPATEELPTEPALLYLVVERAEGLFPDEAPSDEDEE
jgi:hypothetical protein